MAIGLIGAMEEEISLLVEQFGQVEEQSHYGCRFYCGRIVGKEVVLLKSGIGKVSAAIGVILLKERFNCDYVINTGSAGGLKAELGLGAIVVSSSVAYFDVDVTAFGYEPGQMASMPAQFSPDKQLQAKAKQAAICLPDLRVTQGLIVSGDSFINNITRVEAIKEMFPEAYALEMEAGGIAQACYQLSIPFIVIRSVSDSADGEAKLTHEEFLQLAANNSAQLVSELVKLI